MRRILCLFVAIALYASWLASPAYSQSIAETLEKGIYKEETENDLKGAIELYRQVVTQGDTSRAIAAQAQFRIGQCLKKDGRDEEATKAFQQLVERYPDQEELVASAQKFLPDSKAELTISQLAKLKPVWKAGERQVLEMRLAGGQRVGMVGTRIIADQIDGRDVWRMFVRTYIGGGMNQGSSRIVVDAKTNLPIESSMDHVVIGRTKTKYVPGKVIYTKFTMPENKPEERVIDLKSDRELALANDQSYWLFRQLPIGIGYKTIVPIQDGMAGGTRIPLGISISKMETVETLLGPREAFRMDLEIGQTFWMADSPDHQLVGFEAGGVTARLESVENDESRTVTDGASQVSVTASEAWFSETFDPEDNDGISLIDSRRLVSVRLVTKSRSELGDDEVSINDVADKLGKRLANRLRAAKLREGSQQDVKLAGLDAISRIYEGTIGKHPFVAYQTVALSDERGVVFLVLAEKSEFEASMAELDEMRDTVTLQP